jgi:hypothetical protein
VPATTAIVGTFAELKTATATASTVETIILAGTIVCEEDPCAGLEVGQKLLGSGTVAGLTLVNPGAKLDATRAGDESTPPEDNNITVVELAANSSVEDLEISGRDMFTAINGVAVNLREPSSSVDDPVPSAVSLKNVNIVGATSNAPFSIKFTGPPAEAFEAYYDLDIDGLTITNVAANPVGISAFSSLELRNSTIAIDASVLGQTGITVRAYSGPATAVIENLTVTSAKGAPDFSPLEIGQSSAGGVFTATLKDTTVTFADGIDLQNDAFPFYFNFGNSSPGDGKIVITAESTGNTSNTTSADPIRWTGGAGKIEGSLQLNGVSYSRP